MGTRVVLLAPAVIGALTILGCAHPNEEQAPAAALRDSLAMLARRVDSLEARVPGLGEYMTAIQLHLSKLWFASRAGNAALADYEVGEAREAFDGAIALHATRHGIDVSAVLQSMVDTLVVPLRAAITRPGPRAFQDAYRRTLAGCNTCHTAAGYPFIRIVVPAAQPVTNQRWRLQP